MVVEICLSLWWIWLSVSILRPVSCEEQENITALSGQNVNLTCQATNKNPIIVLEWTRADLDKEYVLLYRDKQIDASKQKSSFKNRVELQDRQMKDGDVSLILKNVTSADAGRYECRVFMRRTNRRKRANLKTDPISTINLRVAPPGPAGGTSEDGGKEDGGKEDGGKKDGVSRGHLGIIMPLLFICVAVILIIVKKKKKDSSLTLPSHKESDQLQV